MNKVKITVEQEKAFEGYKVFTKSNAYDNFNYWMERHEYWVGEFEPLKNFTPEQFALLLCGWYEVEEPLKVGDWVRWEHQNKIEYLKVAEIKCYGRIYFSDDSSIPLKDLYKCEKVTEQWKIMLLKLGREKPEFKVGDKYETTYFVNSTVTRKEELAILKERAEKNQIKYFYPVESRIEVKHENN